MKQKMKNEDWREMQLGDVVTFQRGFDLPKKDRIPGEYPLMVSNGQDGMHCAYKAEAPGVVTGRSGTLGQVFFVNKNFWPLNTTLWVKDFHGNNVSFIYYFLKTLSLERYDAGSGVPTLNRNHIHPLPVRIPPLPEQKAIAGVLSSLDDKIDLLHRQNKTLEDMTQALFRKWFIDEPSKNWEEKPLGEVTDIAIGRTPPRKEFQWFSRNSKDWKWVSIKDMGTSGVYILDTSEYLTREAVEKFSIPIIPENTVVLSFKMTVGRVGITTKKMLSNEAIAHFKFNSKTPFSKEFLYLYLKTFNFDSLGSTSSIVTSINSTMIKEMLITIPGQKTFNKFHKISELLFEKIFFNQSQICTLENMRDTLLPKLMSGVVRVKFK